MDSLWWYYFEMELEFDCVSGNGGAAQVETIDEIRGFRLLCREEEGYRVSSDSISFSSSI